MRPSLIAETIASLGFPRVSGDAPVRHEAVQLGEVFSPRERGCALLNAHAAA